MRLHIRYPRFAGEEARIVRAMKSSGPVPGNRYHDSGRSRWSHRLLFERWHRRVSLSRRAWSACRLYWRVGRHTISLSRPT